MDKIKIIVKALSDKQAKNIVAIDMRDASPIFDTFVLCTGSNERLMQALKAVSYTHLTLPTILRV